MSELEILTDSKKASSTSIYHRSDLPILLKINSINVNYAVEVMQLTKINTKIEMKTKGIERRRLLFIEHCLSPYGYYGLFHKSLHLCLMYELNDL